VRLKAHEIIEVLSQFFV